MPDGSFKPKITTLNKMLNKDKTQSSIGPIYKEPIGSFGPNDQGYINAKIRKAAKTLVECSFLWSEGHYAHSNARIMSENNPIRKALQELAKIDQETAIYANTKHDPSLFEPYLPSIENQTRWNKHQGVQGEHDERLDSPSRNRKV